MQGLQKTSSLTHLSFKGSSIGDRAAEGTYKLQYKSRLGDIVCDRLITFWTVDFMRCLLLLTVLTTAVRNLHTLEWLDLTACSLTAQGAASTAALIKVQPCFIFAKEARLSLSSFVSWMMSGGCRGSNGSK